MNLGSFLIVAGAIGVLAIAGFVGWYLILPMLASGQARLARQRRESLRHAERNQLSQSDLPPATKKMRRWDN
jgi:hypothetical protein